MSIVKNPRVGCEFQGALRTVLAIGGLIPVVHSNSGCVIQGYSADCASGVYFNHGGFEVPSTSVIERHIVFGGASRLREQIKNTVKIIEGEAYILLNGCESAMVGDDSAAMAKEAVQQGEKVFNCDTAGFRGTAHKGYEHVMTEILRNLPLLGYENKETAQPPVNIFGVLPGTDVFYRGELNELTRILNGIGVKANTFFGDGGLDEIKRSAKADLSIVFSKWGREPAAELERSFGVPVLEFAGVPVGYEAVEKFLNAVVSKLDLPGQAAEVFLQRERQLFYGSLRPIADVYYTEHIGRPAAIFADEARIAALSEFLEKYFGVCAALKIITDDAEKQESRDIQGIEQTARIAEEAGAEIIIGTSLEDEIANKLKIPLLQIGYPLSRQVVINKHYSGIHGALRLAEDYVSLIVKKNDEEDMERLKSIGR